MNDIIIKTPEGFSYEKAEKLAQKVDTQCVPRFWLPAQICQFPEKEGKFLVKIQRRKRA